MAKLGEKRIWYELNGQGEPLVIVSAIDNLVKGAAGQAVQNMNLMFDLPEQTGLSQIALPA